jgi:hypothetical protein
MDEHGSGSLGVLARTLEILTQRCEYERSESAKCLHGKIRVSSIFET